MKSYTKGGNKNRISIQVNLSLLSQLTDISQIKQLFNYLERIYIWNE